MDKIINGKEIANQIDLKTAKEVESFKLKRIQASLHIIIQGRNPACEVYVKNLQKRAALIGIETVLHRIGDMADEPEILSLLERLNTDNNVHGIMVQMPLSPHVNPINIQQAMNPQKDVDGCTATSLGLLLMNQCPMPPCTPAGIIEILKSSKIQINGKHVVVLGRSVVVGKPCGQMFLNEDATVTVCHSKTENLQYFVKQADILVSAIGKPDFITADFIKKDAVIIDAGINVLGSGKLTGDVDFESVYPLVSKITPVPGGVGAMTVSILLKNTVTACKFIYLQSSGLG